MLYHTKCVIFSPVCRKSRMFLIHVTLPGLYLNLKKRQRGETLCLQCIHIVCAVSLCSWNSFLAWENVEVFLHLRTWLLRRHGTGWSFLFQKENLIKTSHENSIRNVMEPIHGTEKLLNWNYAKENKQKHPLYFAGGHILYIHVWK